MSGDDCISNITPGSVVFDELDPSCLSEGDTVRPGVGQYASYYSFTHPGGSLHINLISSSPTSFDAYLYLRQGEDRDGALVEGGVIAVGNTTGYDDNGFDDAFGSRIIKDDLAPGRYTIEITSAGADPAVPGAYGLSLFTDMVTATPTGKLNDTGIAFSGASDTTNSGTCIVSGNFAHQDCAYGRDNDSITGRVDAANDGDGEDGFSFLKVSIAGAPLEASAAEWSCVKDNVTGLMWEVKSDDDGLHDKDDTFTWYNTDPAANGGVAGEEGDDTTCSGIGLCNTEAFVARVNAAGLCGYSDWRVPEVAELEGLLNLQFTDGGASPAPLMDTNFFPNATPAIFWSASPDALFDVLAWGVHFGYGPVNSIARTFPSSVRLVRGDD